MLPGRFWREGTKEKPEQQPEGTKGGNNPESASHPRQGFLEPSEWSSQTINTQKGLQASCPGSYSDPRSGAPRGRDFCLSVRSSIPSPEGPPRREHMDGPRVPGRAAAGPAS